MFVVFKLVNPWVGLTRTSYCSNIVFVTEVPPTDIVLVIEPPPPDIVLVIEFPPRDIVLVVEFHQQALSG